ncbi:MAG: N-acetylmuramoyl-L-alanine amidase [Vicinamibacteraceae bacterium]
MPFRVLSALVLAAALGAAAVVAGRGQAPPATSGQTLWTVIGTDGRRPMATTPSGGREMVTAEELGRVFGVELREDPLTRGLALTVQGKTIVVSPTTGLASIGGRVVTLSTPPVRSERGWSLPMDFVDRALSLVYQPRLDVRPVTHLIVVGDVRVPRVQVRLETQPRLARVHFDVAPSTPHTVVAEPGRLIVRFEATALDLELAAAGPPDLVLALRAMPNTPAVAIDQGPRYGTFRVVEGPEGPTHRTTVELLAADTPATPVPEQPALPGTPVPGQPVMPGSPVPETTPPLTIETPTIHTVVIDPGHGGDVDVEGVRGPGARGPAGTFEKHITLTIARLLKSALEARLGVRALLSREDDRTVYLDERAAFANNNKADLFISLHLNASVSQKPSGAEVFFLSLDGYSPEARRVAQMEGAVLPSATGGDRTIEMMLWEMAQLQHLEQSAVVAGLVEQSLRTRVKMSPRAIQQAPFRVLVGANMPAVLVELGFISNPGEEKLLGSHAYQLRLVDALVDAVGRYRVQLEARRPGTAPASTPGTLPGPAPVHAPTPGQLPAAAPPAPRTP